jgi:hypothetical protein
MTGPFNPAVWLADFAAQGGHWMLTSGGPVLGYPHPAPLHLVEMRDALSHDEAEAIKEHICETNRHLEGLI